MDYSDIVEGFAPKNFNLEPKVVVDMESVRRVLEVYVRDEVRHLQEAIQQDERNIASARQYLQERYQNRIEMRRGTLRALRARWGSEDAIDRHLTGLYTLRQYTKIWGEERPRVPFQIADVPYIIGETTDIVIKHGGTRGLRGGTYSLGPYRIMVPLGATLQDVHWVPVRNPDTRSRHPHHYLSPRDGRPHTCLGSFSGVMQIAVESVEIIQVLRLIGEFCHRYNEDSPLIGVSTIPHLQRLDSQR